MENRPKVLIVDDEESIRYTFENFLSEEGYAVDTAGNYDTALEKIATENFDLIFLDIFLGGKTGIEVLRQIRTRDLACCVVMITGDPNVESASEAVRLGAFDYVSKPVRQETLLHVARTALKNKYLNDEKERFRLHLEATFRSVKDGIITVDNELKLIEINDSASRLCGFGADVVGMSFRSLRCGRNCLESLEEAIKKKKPVEISRVECGNGKRPGKIVSLSATPLLDRHSNFCGGVLVIRDETRLAVLEEELRERQSFCNMVGKSPKMQEIYSLIESLADVQTTVLITGESGTGKELVAEAIHYKGGRGNRPLVKVNCSALAENLLESELFGHVKGAFTGAVKDKIGRFQRADGGTIFLDEIGDISRSMQLRLLRVLQETEFERVGDSTPLKVDVRVIAATNQSLAEKVKRGEFREDLFYRLKVVQIALPPLRERTEDIPLLVDYFLKKFNIKFNREIAAISADVQDKFMQYGWPGNVRELEHALEHAFVLCRSDVISLKHLPREYMTDLSGVERVDNSEEFQVRDALQKAAWNKAKAARLLGIDRKTLYRKMRKHKISSVDK